MSDRCELCNSPNLSTAESQIPGIVSKNTIVCNCCQSYFRVDSEGTHLIFRGK